MMKTEFSSRTLAFFIKGGSIRIEPIKAFAGMCLMSALSLNPWLSHAQGHQGVSAQKSSPDTSSPPGQASHTDTLATDVDATAMGSGKALSEPLKQAQTSQESIESKPFEQKSPLDLRLEQLKAMQAQVQDNFEMKNLACNKKFAVTSCKLDALQEKNELMGPIKKEQAQISQAQKRLRSEQKRLEISEHESPQEIERAQEKARLAQDNFDERIKAHALRLEEHERQLNTPAVPRSPEEDEPRAQQRAKARQDGIKSAQEIYDEKLQQANEHRQEQRQRMATKTLHPKPLPLPPTSGLKASEAPSSPLSP